MPLLAHKLSDGAGAIEDVLEDSDISERENNNQLEINGLLAVLRAKRDPRTTVNVGISMAYCTELVNWS